MKSPSARWSARQINSTTKSAGQLTVTSRKGPESRSTPGARRSGTPAEGQRRISAQRLEQISARLSDRDRAVLASVGRHGFLTSRHLEILHFDEHATATGAARICRRVIARLADHRLLEVVERRVGGLHAGSSSTIWRLGPVGDRLLRQDRPGVARARRKQPSLRFLLHRLAVADCYCDLTLAARSGVFELLQCDVEPASWRRFSAEHGALEVLKPDLFAVTAAGEYEDHWFIEVDRGTESVPTVLEQGAQYERYRRSGREQSAAGLFPRVLWLVPDAHRRDRLRAAIERSSALDTELFRVARMADFISELTLEGGESDGAAS